MLSYVSYVGVLHLNLSQSSYESCEKLKYKCKNVVYHCIISPALTCTQHLKVAGSREATCNHLVYIKAVFD